MTSRNAAFVVAAALSLAAAGTTLAQDAVAVPEGFTEYEALENVTVEPFGLGAEDMEEREVYGADGEQIGEIEELLVDDSGEIAAVVIETEGFLGIGDKDVVLELDQLQFADDRFSTSFSEEQLDALPEWEED